MPGFASRMNVGSKDINNNIQAYNHPLLFFPLHLIAFRKGNQILIRGGRRYFLLGFMFTRHHASGDASRQLLKFLRRLDFKSGTKNNKFPKKLRWRRTMSNDISRVFFALFAVCAVIAPVGCAKKEPADLVLKNGKIVTVDESKPEAGALAVREGKIVALGNDRQIDAYVGEGTQVIDLDGKLAIPGFIDSHAHFTSIGRSKLSLDLTKVKNWGEIVGLVEEAVKRARPGEWIQGRGWHQEKWDEVPEPNIDGLPYHQDLSRVSPDNPVLLTHASGHSSYANAKAMELGGISKETPDPPGGEIVRDPEGNPIGVFRETAQGLVSRAMGNYLDERTPDQVEAERRKVVELAIEECLSKGITCLQDASSSFATIDLFKEFVEQGKMGLRLYVMISSGNDQLRERLSQYRIIGMGDNHLTVRSIKRLIDGALGAHGAWLLEPYEDLPSSTGLNTTAVDYIRETAKIAIENDFQLNIHAIGDRANREVLNIYEEAFKAHPEKKDLRWRIEHSQHLNPADIPRFGQLGVIASMQGIHCTSDGPWVLKRLGEKRSAEGAYVWQKLMKTGATICNGTDAPVEDVNPIPCFYASVTRKCRDGSLFYPDQRMSRTEALRSYTINGAYASFQEDILGSLTPGKLADITVLSKDIMTVPEDEILKAEVLYTIVGGKIAYQK
jgi:predicted amidohydrolase YtcJ